ncbi:NmrA/HSCARG family protein [Nocardia arthritidis]|uniref:NAD(P)H-binding protein n=1 Tax=Nocardia arthritidis TaxID=228602 RepID=A0A6G9YPB1_9NOCA|nr:NmrA/HSCARG family protein [Nocardia arthritidis]QIS14856.1 NAD(P)H-binding protein [Nocardia arthritidis]
MAGEKGTVLVIGATGQQGGAAARQLLEHGWPVDAFVRDPESPSAMALRAAGARLVVGDLDDAAALRSALAGAYGLFLMLSPMEGVHITDAGIAAEERRGLLIAELAGQAHIQHLVYSSVKGAGEETGVGYYAPKERIEQRIAALGLPATVLRPVFFMDNFNTFNRPVFDDGGLVLNIAVREDISLPLIAVRDIGAFAALAFDDPDRYLGSTLALAGDRRTPPEMAEIFGRAAQLPARSRRTPIEQVRAFDQHVASMFAHFNENTDAPIDIGRLREYHPGLLTLADWLELTGWKP